MENGLIKTEMMALAGKIEVLTLQLNAKEIEVAAFEKEKHVVESASQHFNNQIKSFESSLQLLNETLDKKIETLEHELQETKISLEKQSQTNKSLEADIQTKIAEIACCKEIQKSFEHENNPRLNIKVKY